jgi:Tol biopolymer transport system component
MPSPTVAGPFGFTEITNTTGCNNINPSLTADGTRLAFQSDCDLTGKNPDQNAEIFVFNATDRTLTQVTNTVGCNNADPAFSANGNYIAFQSTCDGNSSFQSFQILLFNTAIDALTQVTTTTGCNSGEPSLNADGSRLAFNSFCDLTGNNSDLSTEIFLFNTATSGLTEATITTSCNNTNPSLNADGTRLAFQSDCDLTGKNPDRNAEIFLSTPGRLTQVTSSSFCDSSEPLLSADGTRLAFKSSCNLTGSNFDGNQEIFLFNTRATTLTQVTNTSGCLNSTLSVSADGDHLAFVSDCGNTDGNQEIFLFNSGDGTSSQVTNTRNCTNVARGFSGPSLSADGSRLAFDSFCDLTGGNPDGNDEIFLVTAHATATVTASSTPTRTPRPTNTVTRTPTATNTPITAPTPSPTAVVSCVGDCDGAGTVTVNEIITLVNVALSNAQPSTCPDGVPSGAEVNIALIIHAVNNALNGCTS